MVSVYTFLIGLSAGAALYLGLLHENSRVNSLSIKFMRKLAVVFSAPVAKAVVMYTPIVLPLLIAGVLSLLFGV